MRCRLKALSCYRLLDIPSAAQRFEQLVGFLEEEKAFLALYDDRIAVSAVMPFEGRGWSEILDGINSENSPVFPNNGTRLHISGRVKIRDDLDIYFDIVPHKATFPIVINPIEQMYYKNANLSIDIKVFSFKIC